VHTGFHRQPAGAGFIGTVLCYVAHLPNFGVITQRCPSGSGSNMPLPGSAAPFVKR
jgi:hypothetical protein